MKPALRLHVELLEPHHGMPLGECHLTIDGDAHIPGYQTRFLATTEPPVDFEDVVTDQVVIWARGDDFLVEEGGELRFLPDVGPPAIGYLSPRDPDNYSTIEGRFRLA